MNAPTRVLIGSVLLGLSVLGSAQANIIVRLKNRMDANFIASKYQVKLVDRTPGAPFVLYRTDTAAHAELIEAQMRMDPLIVWAEDDDEVTSPEDQGMKGSPYKGSILPAVGDRSTLYKGNTNALKQINFNKTEALATGRTVRVAVLDSGLSQQQTYLWDKVDQSTNLVEKGQPAYDVEKGVDSNHDGVKDGCVGHGTMVAGVIDQVAPNSRFSIVRVSDSDGVATAWRVIKGLAFAVVTDCEVANVSLGAPDQVTALSDVMDWCDEKNLLVVAAMGNSGLDKAAFPARISKVVAVGGLLPDNHKAPFSNWDGKCDFSAPATGIISQWYDGRIGEWSGTSFSTPMVAGAIVDGLKLTSGPVPVGTLRDRIDRVGGDLDSLNPDYKGELGVLLNVRRLKKAVAGNLP